MHVHYALPHATAAYLAQKILSPKRDLATVIFEGREIALELGRVAFLGGREVHHLEFREELPI